MTTEIITIPESCSNKNSKLMRKLADHKLNVGSVYIADDGRASVERIKIDAGSIYNLNGIPVKCSVVDGRYAFISESDAKNTKYGTTYTKSRFVQWVDMTTPDELTI